VTGQNIGEMQGFVKHMQRRPAGWEGESGPPALLSGLKIKEKHRNARGVSMLPSDGLKTAKGE